MKTLVIGGGGLIGTSLRKALFKEFAHQHKPIEIRWNRPNQAVADLRQLIENFLDEGKKDSWTIAWCAGRGGFSSTKSELENELLYLSVVLDEIAKSKNNNGLFFLASSAGALYTKESSEAFTENSPTSITNDYGRHKFEQENMVKRFSIDTKTKSIIGRLVSIYGPDQNLQKPQGLISQLCNNALQKKPTEIYVPLGTTRNYLFSEDAANMIVQCIRFGYESIVNDDSYSTIKIICNHQSVSISTICKSLSVITNKRTLISTRLLDGVAKYPEHFHIRSVTSPDLGAYCQTTLIAGMGRILRDV